MNDAHYDIVMLTTVHSAVDDRILHREARTLSEAGLSVCVIGRHSHRETIDGVTIDPLPPATTRVQRLLLQWKLFQKALRTPAQVYIFHDPELFCTALLLRVLGKKVVYDAHENLPMQILQKGWIPKPIRYLLVPFVYAAEWLGARLLSGVIVARPNILKRFSGVPTALVRNYPTASALRVLAPPTAVEERRNIAIYTGSITRTYGICELVTAFAGLPNAELWLVGPFEDQELEQEILGQHLPNVKYMGKMPFQNVLTSYASAKIGVLLLYPSPNNRHSLPIKLFEYMAAGLPVLRSNLPELAPLTEGCGFAVDPYDAKQIRAAFAALFSDPSMVAEMSRVGRRRALQEFTWEAEGERLIQFCTSLLSSQKSYSPSISS
jgi:glycosyltransferase involved in cell wall biosynthesis